MHKSLGQAWVSRVTTGNDPEVSVIGADVSQPPSPPSVIEPAILQALKKINKAAIAEMICDEMTQAARSEVGWTVDDEQRGFILQALDDAVQETLNQLAEAGTAPPQWGVGMRSCQICQDTRDGVVGNGNVINGIVVCDYCHADMLKFKPLVVVPSGTAPPQTEQPNAEAGPSHDANKSDA